MTVFQSWAREGQKHMLSKMRPEWNSTGGGWALEIKPREPKAKAWPGARPGLVEELMEEHTPGRGVLLTHLAGSTVGLESGFAIYPLSEGKLAKQCVWGLQSQYSRGKSWYNLVRKVPHSLVT